MCVQTDAAYPTLRAARPSLLVAHEGSCNVCTNAPCLTSRAVAGGSGGSGNSSQSLFKPVGVPAQNPDMLSGGFGGSHLINLDTTPELTGCFAQKTGGGGGGLSAHQQRMLAAQAQGQGQELAQSINALPGPTLDDLTQRMSGMSMGSLGAQQYPQMNSKRVPPSMAGINMMNPNLAAQLQQQQQQQQQQQHPPHPPHPPRTGPSKLSMMTNQQLMILAQTDMPLSKGYKTVLCKFWDHNMCAKVPHTLAPPPRTPAYCQSLQMRTLPRKLVTPSCCARRHFDRRAFLGVQGGQARAPSRRAAQPAC